MSRGADPTRTLAVRAGLAAAAGVGVGLVYAALELDPFSVAGAAVAAALTAWLVTGARAAQAEARQAEDRVRQVLGDAASGCLWTVGPGEAAWYSDAWSRTFGISSGEGQLQDWLDRVDVRDLGGLLSTLVEVRQGALPAVRRTFRIQVGEQTRWAELYVTSVRTPGGVELAGSVADVTERHESEARLARTAFHDSLTGLPNRALLLDRLSHATARARRDPRYRFAVLFLDIDDFKVVNDSLGHQAGDDLLRAVGARLSACVRPGDTVARIGGDEFTILLEDIESDGHAHAAAQRIAGQLHGSVDVRGHLVQLSASMGIVVSGVRYGDPMEMLRDADTAMYHAKRAGPGQQRVFDRVMHESAMRRLKVEAELRRALKDDGLEVHFQPIVDLASGRIEGFEALCRLRTSAGATVSPNEFIPLAETLGLVDAVTERVLTVAAERLATWRELAPDIYISVNVSAQSLTPALVSLFVDALERYELPPRSLAVELTEAGLVSSAAAAADSLVKLSKQGVPLLIDDFGTGYSSLSYLHKLPVDKIKLDRTFVAALGGQRMPDIVETIISLSIRLGAGVVAEGIETPAQLEALVALGCGAGQGFLFAPALPAELATQMLVEGRDWSATVAARNGRGSLAVVPSE